MNGKGVTTGFLFLFVVCAGLVAQDADGARPQILTSIVQDNGRDGHIEIIQPEQAEHLLKKHIANNRLQKGIPGYRIQIFSQATQTANQRANTTRASAMRSFPHLEAYQKYNNPNWQVFVGDFRTKNEALRELKKIARIFPGAFIVSTTIFENI